jgi:glucokinase
VSHINEEIARQPESWRAAAASHHAGRGTPYVVGVDVGGTGIKSALFAGGPGPGPGAELERRTATPRTEDPRAVVDAILEVLLEAGAAGQQRFGRRPSAVGLAVLGVVDEGSGVAVRSVATGWRDVPLRALAERVLDVPVVLGHDVRSAALAEACRGAGRALSSMLMVSIGTGIGAAFVAGGSALSGANGRAAEIGHLPVPGGSEACGCGGSGCLETLASARRISERYERRSGRAATAAEVAARVSMGDADARAVWHEAVEALAGALSAAVLLLDPAGIVVGGGLSLAGDVLLGPLREALGRRATLGTPPAVIPALLGDRSALIGAGILAARAAGLEAGAEGGDGTW